MSAAVVVQVQAEAATMLHGTCRGVASTSISTTKDVQVVDASDSDDLMNGLDAPVFEAILSLLDVKSLAAACCVSKEWRSLAGADALWKQPTIERWLLPRTRKSARGLCSGVRTWKQLYAEFHSRAEPPRFGPVKQEKISFAEPAAASLRSVDKDAAAARVHKSDEQVNDLLDDHDVVDAAVRLTARAPLSMWIYVNHTPDCRCVSLSRHGDGEEEDISSASGNGSGIEGHGHAYGHSFSAEGESQMHPRPCPRLRYRILAQNISDVPIEIHPEQMFLISRDGSVSPQKAWSVEGFCFPQGYKDLMPSEGDAWMTVPPLGILTLEAHFEFGSTKVHSLPEFEPEALERCKLAILPWRRRAGLDGGCEGRKMPWLPAAARFTEDPWENYSRLPGSFYQVKEVSKWDY